MPFGITLSTSDGVKQILDVNTTWLPTGSVVNLTNMAREGSRTLTGVHINTHDILPVLTEGFMPSWTLTNGNVFNWISRNGDVKSMRIYAIEKTY